MIAHAGMAQIEISGLLKDKEGPIPYANVVLKDSTQKIKAYDITDEQGFFSLKVEKGKYLMEASMLGYKDWKREISIEKNQRLDDILLETAAAELNEVVVKSMKPLIERKVDRLIFNVENSVAASGGNALDALQVAPGLIVGTDEISMIGKGASRVMLNGRMLQLSGEELVNFLNSIAADDIQKIEIITNPPAKYEAESSGGLINIVFKKGVRNFWKNSTTYSYSKNKYNYSTLRNNFLYNKNKVKLSLSLNGSLGHVREVETVETSFPSGTWKTIIDTKSPKDNLSGRFSLDYDLSKKTSIGIQYLGNFSRPDRDDKVATDIFNNSNILDKKFDGFRKDNRDITSQIYNVHLISKIDTLGRSISFDFDFLDFDNERERDRRVDTYSANNEFLNINQSATNFSVQSIDNYSAKVDVEHPIKSVKLSYGAKLSYIKTVNDLKSFNTITGSPVFDTNLSNEFEYTENIQAVYISGSKEINPKLEMQMGLRLENTATKGFSKTLDETNKKEYLKLFPTFYVAYNKDKNQNFSFSYGRRINRPWFRNLNPFRSFTNSNSYSEGNPFLRPSFRDNFDFNYTYKEVLTTNVFFNRTTDGSGTIFSADWETNIQAIIRLNYYTDYRLGIGEQFTFNKISWWESQNQFYVIGNKSKFDNNVIDATPKEGIQIYVDTYNTFSLNESTKFQIDFFYSSAYKGGLSDRGERYGLDLGIRKSFMKNDLKLSLFAKDIFDTGSHNNILSEVNGVPVNFGMNYSRRYVRFSMTYKFGNKKINVRNRKFGNDEERRRTN